MDKTILLTVRVDISSEEEKELDTGKLFRILEENLERTYYCGDGIEMECIVCGYEVIDDDEE